MHIDKALTESKKKMKRSTYLLTIFLITALFGFITIYGISYEKSEYSHYRLVEMEDNTYVIQKRNSIGSGWHQNINAFSSHFDSKERACKKVKYLNKIAEEKRRSNTVKRIVDCGPD